MPEENISLEILIANKLSKSAVETTLTLEELINSMLQSGMGKDQVRQVLINDLNNSGRIFGTYKNQVKNTVKNGVGINANTSARKTFEEAGVKQYQCVAIGDKSVCPDCEPRHGTVNTLEYFRTVGLPRSGFSICQMNCRCQILPSTYKSENLKQPILIKKEKDESVKQYWTGLGASPLALIKDYTADSGRINNKLRKNPNLIKTDKTIQSLQKTLKEAPKYKKTVYRGLSFDTLQHITKFMEDVEVGGVMTAKSFWSSSKSLDVATRFSAPEDTGYRAMLKIKSKNGVSVEDVSIFPGEKEVLFPHQSVFKIKKIQIDDGADTVYNIELEQI